MISELKDDEILDFLMTSEFENDYKPEELKYLLFKWRYFYRILYSNKEIIKSDKISEINELKEEIKSLKIMIGDLLFRMDKKDIFIQKIKNKKLSLVERIKGKITLDKEEDI